MWAVTECSHAVVTWSKMIGWFETAGSDSVFSRGHMQENDSDSRMWAVTECSHVVTLEQNDKIV